MFSFFRFNDSSKFVDLTMYQLGQSKCNPGSMPGYLKYDHYLFHYVFSGKGVLYSERSNGSIQTFPVEAGQGFMIFPGYKNNYIADMDDPWHYCWIEFDGLLVRDLLRQARLQVANPIFTPHDGMRIEDALKYIMDNPNNPSMELISHLYMFASSFANKPVSNKLVFSDSVRDFYVKEAIEFIYRNYPRNLSVGDIAEHCNIHRSYLSRIFKTATGVTPQDFLIRCRCDIASDLLTSTTKPIGEISAMVGYTDPLNFSRAFKREIGMSPKDFRKQ